MFVTPTHQVIPSLMRTMAMIVIEQYHTDISPKSAVTFKCIGVLKDPTIQTVLREVRDRRENGEEVDVRLCL